MKMLFITYNVSIESELLAVLETLKVEAYTQWPRVLGVGQATGARLDSNVWPGFNGALAVVVPDEQASAVMAEIRRLRNTVVRKEGLRAFLLPVEEMTE